jgi:hypothetical protein
MGRCATVVLFAVCFSSLVRAQTPSSAPPAEQSSTAMQPTAAATTANEAPWDKFKNFSALMTGGPAPGTADEIHIYRSGNLLRMEGPGKSYIIQDLSKANDVRAISKIQCLQMAAPFIRSYPFLMTGEGYKYEHVALGKETVDGHSCQVEDVTVIFPPAKKHPTLKLKLWEAEDLEGFPIKIETQSHQTIEYRKVDFGPLDPTLFITPNQCAPLDKGDAKVSIKPQKAPVGKPQ